MERLKDSGSVSPDTSHPETGHPTTHPVVNGHHRDVLAWPRELGEDLERELIEPGMDQDSSESVFPDNSSINTDLSDLDLELLEGLEA